MGSVTVALNRGHSYREQAGPAHAGLTVLAHLTASRRHSTAEAWAARLACGEVELDGRPAAGHEVLRPGHTLTWHRPPWEEPEAPLHFEVIHEDAALLAVVKPGGLPTLPAGGFQDHTLLALVRARHPGASPMHRLGRHTSGLVVFARTTEAAAALSRAWRTREVEKRYRALASGSPAWDRLDIHAPIGPVAHPTLGLVHAAVETGRPSHSLATVLERRGADTLFQVDITTGRPHQIRIHLAWAGHPLAGDPLYAAGGLPLAHNPGLPGDGGYLLHAERLRFVHPVTGAPVDLSAPPPASLR